MDNYTEISKDAVFREPFALDNRMSLSVEVLLDMLGIYDFNILLMTSLRKENTVYESFNYQDSSFEQTSIKLYYSLTCQNKVPFFFYENIRSALEEPKFTRLFKAV